MPKVSPRCVICVKDDANDEVWWCALKPSQNMNLKSTDDLEVTLHGFIATQPNQLAFKVEADYVEETLDASVGEDRWSGIFPGKTLPERERVSIRLVIEQDYSYSQKKSFRPKVYDIDWTWENRYLDEPSPDGGCVTNIVGVVGVEHGTQFHHEYGDLKSVKNDIDPMFEYWDIPCFKPENLRDAKPKAP